MRDVQNSAAKAPNPALAENAPNLNEALAEWEERYGGRRHGLAEEKGRIDLWEAVREAYKLGTVSAGFGAVRVTSSATGVTSIVIDLIQ